MTTPLTIAIDVGPEPTQEELEAFRELQFRTRAYGTYIDKHAIPNAPEQLHYEWHPDNPDTHMRMLSLGFKRNDDLAALSPYLTSTEGGNKIQDVICYSIRKEYKQKMDEAAEMAKQVKADPRKTYSDVSSKLNSKLVGEDYRLLPKDGENGYKANNTVRHLSEAELNLEIIKDQKK